MAFWFGNGHAGDRPHENLICGLLQRRVSKRRRGYLAPTISKTVRIGYKGPSSVLYDCTLSVKLLEDRSTATLYPPSLPTVRHEDYIFGTYFWIFRSYVDHARAVSLRSELDTGCVLVLHRCLFPEFIHSVLRVENRRVRFRVQRV